MLFAALVIERETLKWADLPLALMSWVQDAGVIATLGLLLVGLSRLLNRQSLFGQHGNALHQLAGICGCVAVGCLAVFLVLLQLQGTIRVATEDPRVFQYLFTTHQHLFLTIGGTAALVGVSVPVVVALLTTIRWRRIHAIALLSVKEALRGRVVWVFALMALVYLFSDWFVTYRERDQVRAYMGVIYWATAVLMLVTSALLGSFSIPNDVVRQTIHTVVTKPVERYEIVLGRFLGYGFLLTVGLVVLSALSLVYVSRGVTPAAAEESYKGRVPIFGDRLTFHGTGKETVGENVGREWTYRSYIRGKSPQALHAPRQYGIWTFNTLPANLKTRKDPIPFEFTLDIYRTTKGEEDQGVFCVLIFARGSLSVPEVERQLELFKQEQMRKQGVIEDRYSKPRQQARTQEEKDQIEEKIQKEYQDLEERLASQFGVYQVAGVQVSDYVTQSLTVPAGVIKDLIEYAETAQPRHADGTPAPVLKVLITIGDDIASRQQLVGMARRDLYLLSAELPFWQNYAKWVVGIWCNSMLVLGIAVACSTYLSGIISLLCAVFFYLAGFIVEFIKALAEGRLEGGGPFEAATRMYSRLPLAAPLEPSPLTSLLQQLDAVYRYWLGLVLKIVPEMDRFNLTEYVSSGFDIPLGEVLFLDNILPLLGYLLPWGVLAFYTINSREVANPT